MRIRDSPVQFKTVGVNAGGFVKRHKRLTLALAVALLIAGPLLAGTGGETFFLNPVSSTGQALVGLGIVALVVGHIVRTSDRRQACGLPPASPAAADGESATTRRHSMTTITLESPSTTGRLEELAD